MLFRSMAEINKEKKELDDDKVMRSKNAQCQWVKTDFESCRISHVLREGNQSCRISHGMANG